MRSPPVNGPGVMAICQAASANSTIKIAPTAIRCRLSTKRAFSGLSYRARTISPSRQDIVSITGGRNLIEHSRESSVRVILGAGQNDRVEARDDDELPLQLVIAPEESCHFLERHQGLRLDAPGLAPAVLPRLALVGGF